MSLEAQHKTKIDEYNKAVQKNEEIKQQIDDLTRQKGNTDCVFSMLELDNRIHELETDLKQMNDDNVSQYLLNVSSIFKGYYTDSANTEFKFNTSDDSENSKEKTVNLTNFVEQRYKNNRGQLYTQYMNIVNSKPPVTYYDTNKTCQNTICPDCKDAMYVSVNESYIVCENCGNYDSYFEPSITGLTYEQEVNTDTNVNFAYKRINHLRELLAQLQAKESSEIPQHVIDCMKGEFKKARIYNKEEITQEKVKSFLKKLKLNKYYEHTRQITNILTGTPPPVISSQLYETIINMFMEIQEPFDRVCPKNRKNFFSYNYILYKFCELLGEKEHMSLFTLLKSREKLYQQDCIWKEICAITKWPFYKSV